MQESLVAQANNGLKFGLTPDLSGRLEVHFSTLSKDHELCLDWTVNWTVNFKNIFCFLSFVFSVEE